MIKRKLSVAIACLSVTVATQAAEYTNIKPLLIQAIDAPGGAASGVIVGPIADKFKSTTGSSSPVRVEVTTLKSFKQEGCRRLNVRMRQANVPTKDGKPIDFGMDYGMNVCRDGSPPTEGMDMEQVGKMLGR